MINPIGITNTSTFLQSLFLQYVHKAVITIVCLQSYLPVSLHDNILRHLYEGISTVVSSLLSLLTSLRSELLQSSLPTSLRNEFLQLSLLACQWNICLRRLYKDITMVTPIPPKPEIFPQGLQSKPEIFL